MRATAHADAATGVLAEADAGGEHVRGIQPSPRARRLLDAVEVGSPQLDLVLAADRSGHTYLSRQRVGYPFHLGRSLYVPEDPPGMPTLYVQSCSGGIFENDRLRWRVVAGAGTKAHLTSAASTIVHAMSVGEAVQEIELEADAGSYLEYLPDPLILFSDARLVSSVRLRVHPQAVVLLCDAIVPHDPRGAARTFDWIDLQLRAEDLQGTLLLRDRLRLHGSMLSQAVAGITGEFSCVGGFFALCPPAQTAAMLDALRAALPDGPETYAGASRLPAERGAFVRVLARDAAALREALRSAWYAARRTLFGAEPSPRRK